MASGRRAAAPVEIVVEEVAESHQIPTFSTTTTSSDSSNSGCGRVRIALAASRSTTFVPTAGQHSSGGRGHGDGIAGAAAA